MEADEVVVAEVPVPEAVAGAEVDELPPFKQLLEIGSSTCDDSNVNE